MTTECLELLKTTTKKMTLMRMTMTTAKKRWRKRKQSEWLTGFEYHVQHPYVSQVLHASVSGRKVTRVASHQQRVMTTFQAEMTWTKTFDKVSRQPWVMQLRTAMLMFVSFLLSHFVCMFVFVFKHSCGLQSEADLSDGEMERLDSILVAAFSNAQKNNKQTRKERQQLVHNFHMRCLELVDIMASSDTTPTHLLQVRTSSSL